MGAGDLSTTTIRLKREDCKRTKHDSAFSDWKILIGASDWENYLLGKEGIERYKIHNLPLKCSCPGLYELGVAASVTNSGRDIRKLDQDRIVVVYLGQADNVRTRLQHYGRAGSHLELGKSVIHLNVDGSFASQRGPGLFKEIFSRGFPIVFRWAAMENKKEAEKTEAQLLSVFDYAWNKGGNGVRRPNDILLKLDKLTSSNIARKLQRWLSEQAFAQKQSGIPIKTIYPIKSDSSNDQEKNDFPFRIFKFGRAQPRLVSEKCCLQEENIMVCGVSLGDGSFCEKKPVQGRKRCEEHKGKRINGFISTSIKQETSTVCVVGMEDGNICKEIPILGRKRCEKHTGMRVKKSNFMPERKSQFEEEIKICGVVLKDGFVCKKSPVQGRKRCDEHKGQRVNELKLKSKSEGTLICGVDLGDGSVCMELPAHRRKRCELHKGKRVIAVTY